MKRIINISFIIGLIAVFSSCEDYFGTPITQSISQDTVFSSMVNAEKALNSAYYLIPYGWETTQNNNGENGYRNDSRIQHNITSVLTDESITGSTWTGAYKLYYVNGLSPLNAGVGYAKSDRANIEFVFEEPYFYFRRAFLFLEGVDAVPDATTDFLNSSKAQAKLLIAIGYYELIMRYGSVPWVDHALTSNEVISEVRPPLADIIQRVDDLIAEAIDLGLPSTYDGANTGRLTEAAAHFLRAKLWLLAASPIFNTGTPYLDMENPADNNVICYGDYDVMRWKKAADMAKAAIDYCEANGYSLVDTGDPIADYTTATRDLMGNTEVIAFSRRLGSMSGSNSQYFYFRHLPPDAKKGAKGRLKCAPTLNFVKMYETVDGSALDLNQKNPWEKLEPRFHASIIADGTTFGGDTIRIARADDQYMDARWFTGFGLRKFLHEEHRTQPSLAFDAPYFYMRLPELYLAYAEALNEYDPGNADIATYASKTRLRVDLSPIPSGLNQDAMREAIRKERAIELAFEDKRLFDLKRWLTMDDAIGQVNGVDQLMGVQRQDDGTYIEVTASTAHASQRTFGEAQHKFYLMPFPNYEILKEKGLIQNPGY